MRMNVNSDNNIPFFIGLLKKKTTFVKALSKDKIVLMND